MTAHTSLAKVFKALADDDRLRLLDRLAATRTRDGAESASISALATEVGISRFSASHHLATLRDAGLIELSRVGLRHVHHLNPAAITTIEDWLYPIVDAVERSASDAPRGLSHRYPEAEQALDRTTR